MNEKQSCALAPTPIMQLTTAYWDSQTFLTANRIGVFEVLDQEALTAEQLAEKLGLQPRPTSLEKCSPAHLPGASAIPGE